MALCQDTSDGELVSMIYTYGQGPGVNLYSARNWMYVLAMHIFNIAHIDYYPSQKSKSDPLGH